MSAAQATGLATLAADKAAVRAETARILDLFRATGAVPVEADLLQPAERFLDLYGEDIRARAYVTSDPVRGELMLRPDFTLPVVEAHMSGGADPARYCYAGEVFRRQERDDGRRSEYVQVGYELFDGADPARADAEVFALFARALEGIPTRAVTGDMGFITAAVRGLPTSAARKTALLRHIWRPVRFRALLDRYSGRAAVPEARRRLLAEAEPLAPVISGAIPLTGLRSQAEIAARIALLRADAAEPPLGGEVDLLTELMTLDRPAPEALEVLRSLASDLPSIKGQVAVMERRLAALAENGIDPASLRFVASHGRSAMEYYDGFVFTFHAAEPGEAAPGRASVPPAANAAAPKQGTGAGTLPGPGKAQAQPLATGGRYDALTRVLGRGQEIPAVGGVIRPDLLLEAAANASFQAAIRDGSAPESAKAAGPQAAGARP